MNPEISGQTYLPDGSVTSYPYYQPNHCTDNGIDYRLQQQMHFAQPNQLKLAHRPIVYYQDTQPENFLLPSQLSRDSFRQATLSEYNGNHLPDRENSPPLSNYSAKTAKSEPPWRHKSRNTYQTNQTGILQHQMEYFNKRKPSPLFPAMRNEPSHSPHKSRHHRFHSQEITHAATPSEIPDTHYQPQPPRLLPDGHPNQNPNFPQMERFSQHQNEPHFFSGNTHCGAYPPYYQQSRIMQPHRDNATGRLTPQPYATRTQSPSYSPSISGSEMPSRTHGTISSVPALHHTLSPTEAKAQELVRLLVSSQDLTTLCRTATIIQQMTYGDDANKNYFREVGAIQALISHLQSRQDSMLSCVLGALRNLSYGVEFNKRVIATGWGLSNLMQLLLRTQFPELRELTTSVLWNVSSSEYVKRGFLDICVDDLVRSSVIPLANWDTESVPLSAMDPSVPSHVKWNAELKNSTGVLRNLASFGKDCRRRLRRSVGLVDSVLYIVCSALGRDDLDNQIVENCVCILRNLSYRLEVEVDVQEGIEDREIRWDTPLPASNPNYSMRSSNSTQSTKWSKLFCISLKRNSRNRSKSMNSSKSLSPHKSTSFSRINESVSQPEKLDPVSYDHLLKGVTLLWQPEIVDMYLHILKDCSNRETLEATLGALLNLTACEWKWAAYIRTAFRNKKGLPLVIKLIATIDYDLIIKSASITLRNLSRDPYNKVLIGDYAMQMMLERLPGGKHSGGLSESCFQSLLSTVYDLIQNCPDNINRIHQSKTGIPILVNLAKSNYQHSPKTIYSANKVCLYLYDDKTVRPALKKQGWSVSNWQKVVDWLEQETTTSFPSESNLSGPCGSNNASLKNAMLQPRAKSDTLFDKNQPFTHRTLDVDKEGSLYRETSIASSRTSQATNQNSLINPNFGQRKVDPTSFHEGNNRVRFAPSAAHKKLHQTFSYPDPTFRHQLEQVHRDPPNLFSHSPRATPVIRDDSSLIQAQAYNPISAKQTEFTQDPRTTPLDPRLGIEVEVDCDRIRHTPSPNPSVTTGQEESRGPVVVNSGGGSDTYSKVDLKKKRERRRTTQVRAEELPNFTPQPPELTPDTLPSKYAPIIRPQLSNQNAQGNQRRVNLHIENTQATDSWV